PGKNRHSRVARFLSRIPERPVSPQLQRQRHLLRAGLRFLQAKDIRLLGSHEIRESLPNHRAQAVHIPRKQFHGSESPAPPPPWQARGKTSLSPFRSGPDRAWMRPHMTETAGHPTREQLRLEGFGL